MSRRFRVPRPESTAERARAGAQSLVEFGLIALLFTLLLFGIVDFGLLLNGWISVSSAARESARIASLGYTVDEIADSARSSTSVPGVPASQLTVLVRYEYRDGTPAIEYTCTASGSDPCGGASSAAPWDASPTPNADDTVVVTVVADTFQIVTPLVRPFFGCTDGSVPTCYVPLRSGVSMRLEGAYVP